jgi:hypothetical protein
VHEIPQRAPVLLSVGANHGVQDLVQQAHGPQLGGAHVAQASGPQRVRETRRTADGLEDHIAVLRKERVIEAAGVSRRATDMKMIGATGQGATAKDLYAARLRHEALVAHLWPRAPGTWQRNF